MSTICVLQEKDKLIFGTDSRVMAHDFSGVVSDTEQKIFEIAPDTFIATSGRKRASDFQVARARQLAVELDTTDIQTIAAALGRESLPCLMGLVERLRSEPDELTKQSVSGESLLHGCIIVGRTAGGKLGYVSHAYRVQTGGAIECATEAYFEARRKITATSGAPAHILTATLSLFAQDMATWIDSPERVVVRLLEAMKQSSPTIGGPDQVVFLDSNGSHWISRPPQAALPLVGDLLDATVTALASIISPVISGGSISAAYMDLSSPGYSSGITYGLNSLCTYLGIQYKSTAANNYNHQPDISGGWWTLRPSITGATIVGGTITGAQILSTLNGVIVEANGSYDSTIGGNTGLRVKSAASPNYRVVVVPGGIWMMDPSNVGRVQILGDGTVHLYDAAGVTRAILDASNGQLLMNDDQGNTRAQVDTFSRAGHVSLSGTGASITINGRSL